MLTNLGGDEVIMALHMRLGFLARSTQRWIQDGTKIGQWGAPSPKDFFFRSECNSNKPNASSYPELKYPDCLLFGLISQIWQSCFLINHLLRNLAFNRSTSAHCTQVSDQCPLGLLFPNHFQTSHVSCGWWEEESYWFWVTGSKVKVNCGTLCIRPCGHDSHYSFCPITFKLHMEVVDDERRNPIDFGSRGQRSRSTVTLYLVDTIATTVFAQSLSNFTCKLCMMRGGTLLILGHWVKGQGQLSHSVYKTCEHDSDYSFCPITCKLYM